MSTFPVVELLERDTQLGHLDAAFHGAARGTGRVVLVAGEPGIGKTSLVAAFASRREGTGRVLWGTCDDLIIPRPLGPVRDLNGVGADLLRALSGDSTPADFHGLVLAELAAPPRPTLLVFEDVQWGDQATLDLITYLARRIETVPAVLVLTYREGEIGSKHPFHACLGAMPASTVHLSLAPLSPAAVNRLAGGEADAIYAATKGNPFFVSEMVAAGPGNVPPSVAHTVAARAARVSERSRMLLDLVSVVPGRISAALLDKVMPGWPDEAAEAEQIGLIHVDSNHVAFRHELARHAIEGRLTSVRRRHLSKKVLHAMLESGADPSDVVYHAEAAGDIDTVASFAVQAARQASGSSANREAWAHYRRAAEFSDRWPKSERGGLFEEVAVAAYTVNEISAALDAVRAAISAHTGAGDTLAMGRCRRLLSRLHWSEGEGVKAREEAHKAVDLLEPHGESAQLAMAYSNLSQLAMLAGRHTECREWGQRAIDMAISVGDDSIRAHALVNVGVVRANEDPDDQAVLVEAHDLADSVGAYFEAARALLTRSYAQLVWVRPVEAQEYAEFAARYAREHEVDMLLSYGTAFTAWLHLQKGNWAEAERLALPESRADGTVSQILALIVLAKLAVRRGDPDARERLLRVRKNADRSGELQRHLPVLEAEVEKALLSGTPVPSEGVNRTIAELLASEPGAISRSGGQIVGIAALAGIHLDPGTAAIAAPYAAMGRGEWKNAARLWGGAGWGFERSLSLSMLDDDESLGEALEAARGLGARPLVERITSRMRELGMPVPRGPRPATRANPSGLTARQVDVLELVAQGLSNSDIANHLFLSVRTVEHHVAAILMKLQVTSRSEAVRRAHELEAT